MLIRQYEIYNKYDVNEARDGSREKKPRKRYREASLPGGKKSREVKEGQRQHFRLSTKLLKFKRSL